MKDSNQEAVFIFLKKDSVVPKGLGTGFETEVREHWVAVSTVHSIWLRVILGFFAPKRNPWLQMSIFCLLFPVYVVCNNMRNVLQSIRRVLFHIMKRNAPITWYLVWHEGMRVFRGCKAWWSIMLEDDVQQKELSLVKSCPCCLLGTVSGISYVLTSAWCCLREYPLERKMVAKAEQKTLWVSLTMQGRQSCHHHHHQLLPHPQNQRKIILGFLAALWVM